MAHPSDIGDQTEAVVLAELLKLGYPVLLPFGSNHRYDMVVDIGTQFHRVQAKTGRLVDGKIVFKAQSQHWHRGKPGRRYDGEADVFAVYCGALDKLYWVPVIEGMSAQPYLRVSPAKNGQAKNVKWASDFELCPFGDNG